MTKPKFTPCAGSNQRGLGVDRLVGTCPVCRVRTFVKSGIIQAHKASS